MSMGANRIEALAEQTDTQFRQFPFHKKITNRFIINYPVISFRTEEGKKKLNHWISYICIMHWLVNESKNS